MELPKHYDAQISEPKWQQYWTHEKIFSFDVSAPGEIYAVDTPPPTVSGSLHIGHVFSYTQAEVITRYKRMRGFNVYYPLGFDDNGLPTERLVEKELGISGAKLAREEFVEKCLQVSSKYEEEFKVLWQSLGFSVDWNESYVTIDPRCTRISQRSFIDLFKRNLAVKRNMPALYCPICRTSVAQAESEDKEMPSNFIDLNFTLDNGDTLCIATTRPELLPALVAVFVHPTDDRYKHLIGRKIRPPLFDLEVEIKGDEKVSIDKGTGVVMCCTFGDTTDIEWFHKHKLELRVAIGDDGTMTAIAGKYSGLKIKAARAKIIEDLQEAGFILAQKPIVHPVNLHERCGNELEYIVKPQWFINILDKKDELVKLADQINWYPEFMKERYISWVTNLKWDWCISRQRFFGIPFPVWYCSKCNATIVANDADLPVNPLSSMPKQPCHKCGSTDFIPEPDVLDTWATSSLTPQIIGKWGEADSRMPKLFPLALRPQAHDIIRTWAFYTIVKAYYHQGTIPWKDIMISGHVLAQRGEKISKSKNNAKMAPAELIKNFSADPIRYWAAGTRLGIDGAFSEDTLKEGKRLVTKLWNASKFVLMSLDNYSPLNTATPKYSIIDKWILNSLAEVISTATRHLDGYEYGLALQTIEQFFWRDFCDNFIELSKGEIKSENIEVQYAAQHTLYTVLFTVLKLFSPYMPHITEEIYQLYFTQFEDKKSIHLTCWPTAVSNWKQSEVKNRGDAIIRFVELLRKAKTDAKVSLATPIAKMEYKCPADIAIEEVLPQIAFLLKVESFGKLEDYTTKVVSDDGSMEIALKMHPPASPTILV